MRLLKRTQKAPTVGKTELGMDFDEVDRLWCDVRTKNGVFFFDGVAPSEGGGDVPVTHELWMEFYPKQLSERWLELEDGKRLKILHVDDLEERHLFHRLICTARGQKTKAGATS